MKEINRELKEYIDTQVLPQYTTNIGGHGIDHIRTVINRSFEIMEEFKLDADPNMVYAIAAFHDIGYKEDPENHEEVSSRKFREDKNMTNFFSSEQIDLMADAIVDHRASLPYEARNTYGKIVSSADREISVENMLNRSFKYHSDKHKEENPTTMQIIEYSYKKLFSKYGKEGYAKMYYPDKKYIDYLRNMQELLENKEKFVEAELKIAERIATEKEDTVK